FARLQRVTTMEAMGRFRLLELARVHHRSSGRFPEPHCAIAVLCYQPCKPGALCRSQSIGRIVGSKGLARFERASIRRRCDHTPFAIFASDLDPVIGRETILELFFAITTPHDSVDGDSLRKF